MDAVHQLLSNHLCLSVLHYNSKNIRSINLKLEHIVVYGNSSEVDNGHCWTKVILASMCVHFAESCTMFTSTVMLFKKCHLLRFKLCKECERVAFSKKKVRSDISF